MIAIALESGPLAAPAPNANGVRAYLGVPFAAPPVGPLRWRAPAPLAPWTEPRAAEAFGPSSMQGVVWDDIDLAGSGVSEDCLYANVWTPAAPGADARLPVLFWIHGGGFVAGSASEPRYDGARLAARGIVVVGVNYRLNALGFLAHPELTAESGFSGNFGLYDLVAALEWTKANIAAFGGDPAQVTIAGESAGSMAVSALMASPLAKGLFARAIGQSGALFSGPVEPMSSLAKAEARGLAFQRELGVGSLAQMRALPAQAILDAAPGLGSYRPGLDGRLLPRPLDEIFAAGEQNDAPLIAGWTQDEGFNFTLTPGAEDYETKLRERLGAVADAVLAHYPAGVDAPASAAALGGDLVIINKTWAWIEAQKTTGRAPVFRYRFDRAPPVRPGWFGPREVRGAGAFHAGDIPYVLDTLDAMPWDFVDADRATAATASGYWLNFVKTGDPNGLGLPHWPSWRESEQVMLIDGESRAAPEPGRERQAFLRGLARPS